MSIKDLIQAVPGIEKLARIQGEQIANVGSQDMSFPIMLKLAGRINELLATDEISGVVITHGTDTMAYTAAALTYILDGLNKPVVITGSQYSMMDTKTDAIQNLNDAMN